MRENLEAARKASAGASTWTLERIFALFPALQSMQRRPGGLLSGGEQQIARLKSEGLTILLCEQNLSFATALCDRVYLIDTGLPRFAGTFEELEANPELKRAHLMV